MVGMRALQKSKTLQYGVPMMLLIIGGSFGLREFTQIRYDAHKLHSKVIWAWALTFMKTNPTNFSVYMTTFCGSQRDGHSIKRVLSKTLKTTGLIPFEIDPALEERIKKNKVTLESEYEKLKDSSFDDWKNIRGPRPWEESKPFQEQQR